MSLYLGENKIADNTCSRNIGEIIQSTIPLTDAGLHLLDGAVINGAGSYAKFVNYIAGLVSNHPDLFTTEANWQSSVTTYGVCGKFVYDSVNNTVRLPKITGFTEGTIDPTVLGNLTEAGLPNITGQDALQWSGEYNGQVCNGYNRNGALSGTRLSYTNVQAQISSHGIVGTTTYYGIGFDASLSNSIYGNSTTVQPQSIKVLYYIVIATSTKTSIEADIDKIATDLNGKADVDLTNVNSSGTSLASGWAMPSTKYIDLTIGANGSFYTAPANGWFIFQSGVNSGGYLGLRNTTTSLCFEVRYSSPTNGKTFVPVCKNDVIEIGYENLLTTNKLFRFTYAEGEN